MKDLQTILTTIGLPEPTQKIYISLLKDGEATARTLANKTGIARTSVYDHIKILRTKDLVVERTIDSTTLFAPSDVRQLNNLLNDKISQLDIQQKFLTNELPKLIKSTQTVQPKIRFFEGTEGVQQLLKDILWYDNITLYIYWPHDQMLSFLGEDFLLWFRQRREIRNIKIKTIWTNAKKLKKHIFSEDKKNVERRYLTQKNVSSMSYIIYENKVAFISSNKESFGFIVDSKEFMNLTKMQFNVLWNNAK